MDRKVEIVLDPASDRFDPVDDRWMEHVEGLVGDLRDTVDGVERHRKPVAGTKGFVSDIVLPVMSTGAVSASIGVVASWVSRDRGRSVRLTLRVDGSVEEFEMSGSELDEERVDALVASVIAGIGGATT
jgi:hypothetical protein